MTKQRFTTIEPGAVRKEPGPDRITYGEYYRRHGFLPPGFSIVFDGKTIHGGCHRWRAWADAQGYPQEPSPHAPRQHQGQFERQMREIYRPWTVR